jgi:hypothetical protein
MVSEESNIAEQLRHLCVPIQSLQLDPKNARKHDERNLGAIKASLDRFGQRLPVVVQRQGMIVRAGNGRVEAMREMGWAEVAAVIVDETDVEATAFAIADNRSSELADWDFGELSGALDMLAKNAPDLDLDSFGWSESEIAGLALAGSWDDMDFENDEGLGERSSSSGVVIKFTEEEFEKITKSAAEAGMVGTPDAEVIVELCTIKPLEF